MIRIGNRLGLGALLAQTAFAIGFFVEGAWAAHVSCPGGLDTCAQKGINVAQCNPAHNGNSCKVVNAGHGTQMCCCYDMKHY